MAYSIIYNTILLLVEGLRRYYTLFMKVSAYRYVADFSISVFGMR